MAFFVPLAFIDAAWAFSLTVQQGTVDLLKHPNTGCMHDDHTLRALWSLGPSSQDPPIASLEFPCNVPATGCQDRDWGGEPSCGCVTPLASDAPDDSCENCARYYDI